MNPLPFNGVDIGDPATPGDSKFLDDRWEIVAGGVDIWGTRDEFHYSCLRVAGDFELTARLDSLTMADVYTKAGLHLRTSLESGAEHAFMLAFGDNQPRNKNNGGIEFQYRETLNGACTGIYPPQPLPSQPDFPVNYPNVWLSLIRHGDLILGLHGTDPTNRKIFCRHLQRFPATLYVGLAVTAHHAEQSVKAVFSQVQLKADIIGARPPK